MPAATYKALSEARAFLLKILPSSFLSIFYATTALYARLFMDTHTGFPALKPPRIERLQSQDSEESVDEEVKISRADRRRMKQRQHRQNWRRNNQAGNQGAQPETTLSPKTRSDIENRDLITYHDENNSEPAQKTKLPCSSSKECIEILLTEFRANDTSLTNRELVLMIHGEELEVPSNLEILKRVPSCVRDVLAKMAQAKLDEREVWTARALAFFLKWLLRILEVTLESLESLDDGGVATGII